MLQPFLERFHLALEVIQGSDLDQYSGGHKVAHWLVSHESGTGKAEEPRAQAQRPCAPLTALEVHELGGDVAVCVLEVFVSVRFCGSGTGKGRQKQDTESKPQRPCAPVTAAEVYQQGNVEACWGNVTFHDMP